MNTSLIIDLRLVRGWNLSVLLSGLVKNFTLPVLILMFLRGLM